MEDLIEHGGAGPVGGPKELRESLIAVGTALQRLFYSKGLVALVTLYLLMEGLGIDLFVTSKGAQLRSDVAVQLDLLDPLLRLNGVLIKRPEVVTGYRRFLAPFAALEGAAVNAIVGADVGSPEWKRLSPEDLDRARDITVSTTNTEVLLDTYDNDDYREIPVFNLIDLARLFVHPDPLDHAQLHENWEASLRVANGLGHALERPADPWPASIGFPHFVREVLQDEQIGELIAAVPDMEGLRTAVAALQRFVGENDLAYPDDSPRGIRAFIVSKEWSVARLEGNEKVDLTFLPTKVERTLLLVASPVALALLAHLFLGQYRRRARLLLLLRSAAPECEPALVESPWLLSNIDLGGASVAWNRPVLASFFWLGMALPPLSQVLTVAFACTAMPVGGVRTAALLLTGGCLLLTFSAALHVARDRFVTRPALPNVLPPLPQDRQDVPRREESPVAATTRFATSTKGKRFHRFPGPCIAALGPVVGWSSRAEAASGRRPCRACDP